MTVSEGGNQLKLSSFTAKSGRAGAGWTEYKWHSVSAKNIKVSDGRSEPRVYWALGYTNGAFFKGHTRADKGFISVSSGD